jgi:hypothetical protein
MGSRPEIPHCDLIGDFSRSSPRLRFADGGRLVKLSFGQSPAAEWNREMFPPHPDKRRGVCKGFSFSSRRRMLDHLNTVSVAAALPYFLTLTLPDSEFNDSVTVLAKNIKGYLDAFFKRLGRVNPDACGFWRVEWQSRKSGLHEGKLMPHAHLMLWGLLERETGRFDQLGCPVKEAYVRVQDKQLWLVLESAMVEGLKGQHFTDSESSSAWFNSVALGPGDHASVMGSNGDFVGVVGKARNVGRLGDLRCLNSVRASPPAGREFPDLDCMSFFDWCSLAWYHVVGSNDGNHFLAGVSVERVKSWGGVMSYCSKYMAKLGENNFLSEVPIGRSWGVFNRAKIPWAKIVELNLDEETGVRLRRIARRYLERVRGRRLRMPYGVTLYCNVETFKACWARPPDIPF